MGAAYGGNSNSGQYSTNVGKVLDYYKKGYTRDIIIGLTGLSASRVSQIINDYGAESRRVTNSNGIRAGNSEGIDNEYNLHLHQKGLKETAESSENTASSHTDSSDTKIDAIQELENLDANTANIATINDIVNRAKSDIQLRLDTLQKTYDNLDNSYNEVEVELLANVKQRLNEDMYAMSVDKLLNAIKVISSIERRGLKFARDRVVNNALDQTSADGNLIIDGLVKITLPTHIINNFMLTPQVKMDSMNRVIKVGDIDLVTMDSNTLMENTVSELPQSIIPEGVKQLSNKVDSVNKVTNNLYNKVDNDGNNVSINYNANIIKAARHAMASDRYTKAFNKECSELTDEEKYNPGNL